MNSKIASSEVLEKAKVLSRRTSKKEQFENGLTFERMFTVSNTNPFDQVKYAYRKSKIAEPDGTVVFQMDDTEVPEDWSQLATDIIVSKYFRKAGVPKTEHEVNAKQIFYTVPHTITEAGIDCGYFKDETEAKAFEDELIYMLITQRGAFNSPVWFNCGLLHQYGIRRNN